MSTIVHEAESKSLTDRSLDHIAQAQQIEDPGQRLDLIDKASYNLRYNPDPEVILELVNFASQPGSLLARMTALDNAILVLANGDILPELEPLAQQVSSIIPEYFDADKRWAAKGPSSRGTGKREPEYYRAYKQIFQDLVSHEGVSEASVFRSRSHGADYAAFYDSYDELEDDLPVAALMILDRVTGLSTAASKLLPTAVVQDALEVALDFSGDTYQRALKGEKNVNTALKFVRLAKLVHAADFPKIDWQTWYMPMHEVLNHIYSLPEEKREIYADLLLEIHDSAGDLAQIFPNDLKEAVLAGAHKLIADSIFATAEINSDNEPRAIKLLSGYELPAHFKPGEDMEMLAAMNSAFKALHEIVSDPDTRVVRSTNETGYSFYRFIQLRTGAAPRVSLHIRPYPSADDYGALEFARRNEGVEASIGFEVSLDDDDEYLMPLGNQRGGGNTLSVRLDRVGLLDGEDIKHRDPTRADGHVELDIGSVLGNEKSLNTRIGRFIAAGNSSEQKVKYEKGVTLNHIGEVFSPIFGHRDIFAAIAQHFETEIKKKLVTRAELDRYLKVARANHSPSFEPENPVAA